MRDPETAVVTLDTLLRLTLIEGFTADHLRRLRSPSAPVGPGGGTAGRRRISLVVRAERALSCPEAERAVDAVRIRCDRSRIAILSFFSADYPEPLRHIPGAPLVLYRAGRAWTGGTAVAVVGSRSPTNPGREFARVLSAELAAAGCTVVSGMARGIDGAAHRGALHAEGRTVAVLGCGVDVAYPPEHADLLAEIASRGTVYSEYPPGSLPLAHRFPERNRIVSGLSDGVVVGEARERSGALITARLALEQGREVMAVPGSPWFSHTAGSNRLIREGAAPVCSAADVFEALGAPTLRGAGCIGDRLLDFLSRERHIGEISGSLAVPVPELLAHLTDLEVANLVVRSAGDYYKRKS